MKLSIFVFLVFLVGCVTNEVQLNKEEKALADSIIQNAQRIHDNPLDSITPFGSSSNPISLLRGDMDCDGKADFKDINAFTLAIGNRSAYELKYPNCWWFNGDMNCDGKVDFKDVNIFVSILSTGKVINCPGTLAIAEPNSVQFQMDRGNSNSVKTK